MTEPILCLVTDRRRLADDPALQVTRLLELITEASQAGIDLVQLREPDLSDRGLSELTREAVAITSSTRTRILVNDRIDIALTSGAAGVHLKSDSVSPVRVRALSPEGWLVGRSVHSVDEVEQLVRDGLTRHLDYLVMGTVFTSTSKPGRQPQGLDALEAVARVAPIPTLAIGGVTADRISAVGRTGAAGVAAIGAFVDGSRRLGVGLGAVVPDLRAGFGQGRRARPWS